MGAKRNDPNSFQRLDAERIPLEKEPGIVKTYTDMPRF